MIDSINRQNVNSLQLFITLQSYCWQVGMTNRVKYVKKKGMGSDAETPSSERTRERGAARLIVRIGATSIGESTFTRRRVSSNLTKVGSAAATFLSPHSYHKNRPIHAWPLVPLYLY